MASARAKFLIGGALVLGTAGYLMATSIQDTGMYYLTPTELSTKLDADPTFVIVENHTWGPQHFAQARRYDGTRWMGPGTTRAPIFTPVFRKVGSASSLVASSVGVR